jgi:flagellin
VTIDSVAYTFKTALSSGPAVQGEVLIGASGTTAATNLTSAINHTGTAGTDYTKTAADVNVTASDTGGVITLTQKSGTLGTAGNAFGLVTTAAGTTVSGATFSGGVDTTTVTPTVTNTLSTATDAQATLKLVNAAISSVASLRGTLGANVNRLQSASAVITNEVQNLTSAEDGIRAADIPSVVANLSRFTILNQSGISALAQANSAQQSILTLLR